MNIHRGITPHTVHPPASVPVPQQNTVNVADFSKILASFSKKKNVSPQELLGAQIQCHRYQLQIELVSKCADAASTTIKKLQQGGQ